MPHNRFFLNAFFQPGSQVILEGQEAHHLKAVMRKAKGACIELVNGKNQLAQATIVSIEKRHVTLSIEEIFQKPPPQFAMILCQAIPRLNRLDYIVEKGTELGMSELWLFPGMHSEKEVLNPNQLRRLEMLAIAAMKQCGRLDLPKIIMQPPVLSWKESDIAYPGYFGDLTEEAPLLYDAFSKHPSSQQKEGVLLFIGPESGFTLDETKHLQHLNVQGVRLHSSILRTDTAAIVALSLISHFFYK